MREPNENAVRVKDKIFIRSASTSSSRSEWYSTLVPPMVRIKLCVAGGESLRDHECSAWYKTDEPWRQGQ